MHLKPLYLDLEANKQTKKIKEIGLLYQDNELKTSSLNDAKEFIKRYDTTFICGHNFVDFDLEILKEKSIYQDIKGYHFIDTLPLSLLLFSEKTIHKLPKMYKTEDDFENDPVEDCKLTAVLLDKLEVRFRELDRDTQNIFYTLLKGDIYFNGFFEYCDEVFHFELFGEKVLYQKILSYHDELIINKKYLKECIKKHPVQLAYILAILTPHIEIKSHPPKILYTYPNLVDIQKKLCFSTKKTKDELKTLANEIFGFPDFRPFPKLNPTLWGGNEISQRDMVEASLSDESFLTVLPTGGGKTFTFWLPAIIKAHSYKGLTVVISPLQALIEDHIKSFNSKVDNYKAVAISGFMSPLERAEAIEFTINGEADILYIAPESLRSTTIFNILKNRYIERFVIDEAHCLSTWGNDFRQDYFYICEYINDLLEKKNFQGHIPISCFTATAKPKVIKDIKEYFLNGLDIKLDEYIAVPERKNLNYKSISSTKENKYNELLKLINDNEGSTLVYIPSSTKDCDDIASKLSQDTTKEVKSFHSKLDSATKMSILKDYIENRIDIIVATTAFGMGVDKSNIMNVIHYEMSDSLENYAQEAGRGARDEKLEAFCPILYDEDDLDKHFITLNRNKITDQEINSIFRVLKDTKREKVTKTAFELAKSAGWDVEDNSNDYSTKIKTALLELEREGYIERKRNRTHFYADSIASKSFEKLHKKLDTSSYSQDEKDRLVDILSAITGRGKVDAVQIDELAFTLGYRKDDIALSINQLKELEILGDNKDLSLEINRSSRKKFEFIKKVELSLFEYLQSYHEDKIKIQDLNQYLLSENITDKNQMGLIKDIIKNWKNKTIFLFKRVNRQNDLWYFEFKDKDELKRSITTKHLIASKIIEILLAKLQSHEKKKEVEFSLKELRNNIGKEYSLKQIDKALLYLHHLHILELLQGRFINYSPMVIHKTDKIKKKRKYTKNEYDLRLQGHYTTKIEAIHIMGEYAKRLQKDESSAMAFLRDYFTLQYDQFLKQYNLVKKKLSRPITQKRYNKIFSQMSDEQRNIILDKHSKAMMILAGPGSGKTKVLVHKIASLILTEDIKPEQFMMLTFSRTAKGEFKSRLNSILGSLSFDVEIHTFHSFALKVIGRVISKRTKKNNDNEEEELLKQSIINATEQINSGEAVLPYTKVLVLDEFQDINEQSFELIKAIYKANNEELRIIAVGDDDQCIMTHIGAKIEYIDKFKEEFSLDDEGNDRFRQFELITNFRSTKNIVEYCNHFIKDVDRYKTKPLVSNSSSNGEVNIFTFTSKFLLQPTINLIKGYKDKKDIAVLAYTNEEVMQIYSYLHDIGINAKFIIDREKFYLKNIDEVVEYDKVLNTYLNEETYFTEDNFNQAFEVIKQKFQGSKNLKLLENIVDRFIAESEGYFITQWYSYLDEIKLEEFENYSHNITISTIHKSKGMEFEKVILLNNLKYNTDKNISQDEKMRLYYVGMTRAKSELNIFRFGSKMPEKKEYANYFVDDAYYPEENKIFTHIMDLGDLNLGWECWANNLVAGISMELRVGQYEKFEFIYNNRKVAIGSNSFNDLLKKKINEGFVIESAVVDYMVWWYNKEKEKYLKYPLCRIVMRKV